LPPAAQSPVTRALWILSYKVLKYRILGGTWAAWHSGQITCVSSGYLLTLNGFADVYVKEQ
jgi:hypothetical protein